MAPSKVLNDRGGCLANILKIEVGEVSPVVDACLNLNFIADGAVVPDLEYSGSRGV
jgi:hypothetical protein